MTTAGRLTILVVEDDSAILSDLRQMLERIECKAITARTSQEGITKLLHQKFDCILLDIRLERGSGEEIVAHLTQNNKNPNHKTPIIVMSAYLQESLLKRLAMHVKGALVKPFTRDMLIERLATVLPRVAAYKPAA